MFRLKSTAKSTTNSKKYTLRQMFDSYDPNEQANYSISIKNSQLHTFIHRINGAQNINYNQNGQEGEFLYEHRQQRSSSKKKTSGLFGKIIKKMEIQKITSEEDQQGTSNEKQFPFNYNYYYEEFRHKDRATETHEQRALQSRNNRQNVINISDLEESIKQLSESKKHTSAQMINSKQSYTMNKGGHHLKRSKNKELIDINFSFDEINEQLKEKRLISQLNQDTIINKYLYTHSIAQSKQEGQSCDKIKQIFMIKEVKDIISHLCGKKLEEEEQVKKNGGQLDKINPSQKSSELVAQNMQSILHERHFITGTKPIESQIYEGKSKSLIQQVKIDFDLDLNFI